MNDHTPAKLKLIADAELRWTKGTRANMAPVGLKALLVVLAAHEGQYLSILSMAERTGLAPSNVAKGLRVLQENHLVVCGDEQYHRMRVRVVDWRRLARMQTTSPTYRTAPGTKVRYRDAKHINRRKRNQRYMARRRAGLVGGRAVAA